MSARRIARLQLTALEGQLLASHVAQGLQGQAGLSQNVLDELVEVLGDTDWHDVSFEQEAIGGGHVRGLKGIIGRKMGHTEVILTLRGRRRP